MRRINMRLSTTIMLLAFLVSLLTCQCSGQDSTVLRTWVSMDGQQQIEAEFVRYDPKSKEVELKTHADETIVVQLQNFSRADQRFVTHVARKGIKQLKNANSNRPSLSTRSNKSNHNHGANLFGIHWTKDISSAKKLAKGSNSPNEDKPIFWFRVLGQLDGFM